jgi:hypothetical protein
MGCGVGDPPKAKTIKKKKKKLFQDGGQIKIKMNVDHHNGS